MKFENINVMNFENALRGMRNPKDSWHLIDSKYGIAKDGIAKGICGDVAAAWAQSEGHRFDTPGFDESASAHYSRLLKEGILRESPTEDIVEYAFIGPKDMDLAQRLIKGGSEHRKFLRQIFVSVDITAPLYWWKEFDTYKVGTTANSTSTMHTIQKKPITLDCFETGDMCGIADLDCEWGETINNHNGTVAKDNDFDNYISWCYDDADTMTCEFINFLEDLRKKYLLTKDKRYWKELIRWLPESWLQTRTVTMTYENIYAMRHQRGHHKLVEWSLREEIDTDSDVYKSFMQFADSLPYVNDLFD